MSDVKDKVKSAIDQGPRRPSKRPTKPPKRQPKPPETRVRPFRTPVRKSRTPVSDCGRMNLMLRFALVFAILAPGRRPARLRRPSGRFQLHRQDSSVCVPGAVHRLLDPRPARCSRRLGTGRGNPPGSLGGSLPQGSDRSGFGDIIPPLSQSPDLKFGSVELTTCKYVTL